MMAPTKATRSTRDATSNGMAQRVKRELASSLKAGLWASVSFTELIKKRRNQYPKESQRRYRRQRPLAVVGYPGVLGAPGQHYGE